MDFIYVAIGGALGSVLRYIIGKYTNLTLQFWDLPLGTIIVNIIGCFAIGFLAIPLIESNKETYRLLIIVGFLGGFTTFSSFGYETIALIQSQKYLPALLNIAISLLLGLIAVIAGYLLNKKFF